MNFDGVSVHYKSWKYTIKDIHSIVYMLCSVVMQSHSFKILHRTVFFTVFCSYNFILNVNNILVVFHDEQQRRTISSKAHRVNFCYFLLFYISVRTTLKTYKYDQLVTVSNDLLKDNPFNAIFLLFVFKTDMLFVLFV